MRRCPHSHQAKDEVAYLSSFQLPIRFEFTHGTTIEALVLVPRLNHVTCADRREETAAKALGQVLAQQTASSV